MFIVLYLVFIAAQTENQTENSTCLIRNQCFYCMFDPHCTYDQETGCMASNMWVDELLAEKNMTSQDKQEINLTEMATYPQFEILNNVTRINATNYHFRKYDICGTPQYCLNTEITGNEAKFTYQNGTFTIEPGQYCSWFFLGDDRKIIVSVDTGLVFQDGEMILTNISACLVTEYDKPCKMSYQHFYLRNYMSIQFYVTEPIFRLSLQFQQGGTLDLSNLQLTVISQKILYKTLQYLRNRKLAEIIFAYFVKFLLCILLVIFSLVILKFVLKKIMGQNYERYIDPPPLTRKFNSQKFLNFLKKRKYLKPIQYNGSLIQFDQHTCAYCLEPLQDKPLLELFCKHVFHEECLLEEIKVKETIEKCSLCYAPIREQTPQITAS
ncbi:hypothetical protein pb186bvf_002679 [Paramecium bursaria]